MQRGHSCGHIGLALPPQSHCLLRAASQSGVQLLSATGLLQLHPGESVNVEARQLMLAGTDGPGGCNPVVTQVNPSNNLPMNPRCLLVLQSQIGARSLQRCHHNWSAKNVNLSKVQKKLVRWRNRQAGRVSCKHIQSLMGSGTLACSETTCHLHTAASKLTKLSNKCAPLSTQKAEAQAHPRKEKQHHLRPSRRIASRSLGLRTARFIGSFCGLNKGQIVQEPRQNKSRHHALRQLHLLGSCFEPHGRSIGGVLDHS